MRASWVCRFAVEQFGRLTVNLHFRRFRENQRSGMREMPQGGKLHRLSTCSGLFKLLMRNGLESECDGGGLVPVVLSHGVVQTLHRFCCDSARREDVTP